MVFMSEQFEALVTSKCWRSGQRGYTVNYFDHFINTKQQNLNSKNKCGNENEQKLREHKIK